MNICVIKDFFREIKRNLGRFLSIFFIVALGTAFFSGIRSTGYAMKYSADIYYDETDLMDIKVIGTLGLTEDDLSDIKGIEGVKTAVGAYTKDVLWQDGQEERVLRTISMTDDINQAYVTEGRLPERPNECLLDAGEIFSSDVSIGDVIRVSAGSADEELSDSLRQTEFTVVGKGSLPYYTDLTRDASTIGDGSTDAFLLLCEDAFAMDVYTEIYVAVAGTKEELSMTDAYFDKVDAVYDKIDAMADAACERRYQSIVLDAQEEIDDAQEEIDDGYQELADAQEEIEDARRELADAARQVRDGEAEVENAFLEIASGYDQLADGQAQLDAKKTELNAAREKLEQGKQALAMLKEQAAALPFVPEEMQAQIAALEAELSAGQIQLQEGEAQIAAAQEEINANRARLEEANLEAMNGQQELFDARRELADGRRELADAEAEFEEEKEDALQELSDAEVEVEDARREVADIKVPSWYVLDRSMMVGTEGYDQNADRIDSLGNVFPVIFFLVAALVSLTAMTRMVDEQRMQIGTMKALGYSFPVIVGRYLWYALLATFGGGIIGVLFGGKFLTYFIVNAYGIMYTGLPYVLTPYDIIQVVLGLVIAALCTGIATLAACLRQLRSNPAVLLRPEAPKNGKRVILEHIPFLWKHLNFTKKATVRNLLRYKKRFIMTVIGVGGCMSLLLVGYGLRDSIQNIVQKQYEEIFHYRATVMMDKEAKDSDKAELLRQINDYEGVTDTIELTLQNVELINGKITKDVTLLVPSDLTKMNAFMTLQNRVTREIYEFPKEGAAISEKTADLLGIESGDMITVRYNDMDVEVEIAKVFENYTGSYLIISEETYALLYDETPQYNTVYVNYGEEMAEKEAAFGSYVMENDTCTGVVFTTDHIKEIEDMLGILNSVIYILIISSGLLAFIVLYNLNSINIMERRRELATLKVLGFYDGEVSMYIFRENMILTIIGIVLGLFFGTILHQYTIQTVEVDLMMFGRTISLYSYVISSILTVGFSLFVNIVMHFSLKKIGMVESLKSVE